MRLDMIFAEKQYFNSTMVRLKDCLLQTYQYHFINFNSTMVRLKVRKSMQTSSAIRKFQFHYGTIKSNQPT